MKRDLKVLLLAAAVIVGITTTIAAVPGIFSSVDSVSGYTINGSAGSGGQALCSDGAHYNTPCATGTGTITAVTVTAPVTGGGTSGSVNVALDAAKFVARTCGGNGCYDIQNGTIHQWGHTSTPVDGSPGNNVCLPFAFPNHFDAATVTDDFAAGATGTPSVAALAPSGSASPFPCANGGFLVRQTRASNGVYWDAYGN
jgi:hypothetical protein